MKGRCLSIFFTEFVDIHVHLLFFNVQTMFFSINDVSPDPFIGPGELIVFSISLVFFYFLHDQRTSCFQHLPRVNKGHYFNDNIIFNSG